MTDILNDFLRSLEAEEMSVWQTLAADRYGLVVRAAINELDWYYYNLKQCSEPSDEQQQQFYILHLGATRLVRLALESREAFDVPTLTFQRSRETAESALLPVAHLGFIEHGRRISDSVCGGLGAVARTSETRYEFTFPKDIIDEAYWEGVVREHYLREILQMENRVSESEAGNTHYANVQRLLNENVRVWQSHFIAYDADPLLDLHFFNIAYIRVHGQEGFDAFRGDLLFGDISFQKYVLTAIYFFSLCLKHEAFCEALIRKEPTIRLQDILTISADKQGFIEGLAEALNMLGEGMLGEPLDGYSPTTKEEAARIYEVMSVSRRNTALLGRPGDPLPFVIEVSDSAIVMSLAGGQLSPMAFLLKSLRYNFPRDCDKHQQTREGSLQRALQRTLDDVIQGLEYRQNFRIRSERKDETDVDFTILDRASGTIVLCQLKSQDPYGLDLRAKRNRTERLTAQATRWLSTIRAWLDRQTHAELRSHLRLGKDFKIGKIYRLVLCGYYAHSLGSLPHEIDTLYANWLQFYNGVIHMMQPERAPPSLTRLIELLQEQIRLSVPRPHQAQESIIYHLDALDFVVREE